MTPYPAPNLVPRSYAGRRRRSPAAVADRAQCVEVPGGVEGVDPGLGQRVIVDQGRGRAREEVVGLGHVEAQDGLYGAGLDRLDSRRPFGQADDPPPLEVVGHDPAPADDPEPVERAADDRVAADLDEEGGAGR